MSLEVTELLMRSLESAAKDLVRRSIRECGSKYGFDSETAIKEMGLEDLRMVRKPMVRGKGLSLSLPKGKKSEIPMPFIAERVSNDGCGGLSYNRGLFTQCEKSRMSNGEYCKGCQSEADKSTSGVPLCGTVKERVEKGLYEFEDTKGRHPTPYIKVLEKLNITVESALAEAGKIGLEVNEEHLSIKAVKKSEKVGRGRPKKASKVVDTSESVDLFAELRADDVDVEEENAEELNIDKKTSVKKTSVKKISAEEKEAKREAMEEERLQKKAEREAMLLEDKASKEAKKAEEKAAKIAEEKAAKEAKIAEEKLAKEAKIAEEKLAKEAKKAEEKAAKIAEEKAAKEAKIAEEKAAKEAKKAEEKLAKEAKIAQEKAAKEAKIAEEKLAKETKIAQEKAAKEAKIAQKSGEKKMVKKADEPKEAEKVAETPVKKTVVRVTINGVQYLKSSDNVLYNPVTKEEMGLWDPETKEIKELPEDEDDEEVESDYEEDN